jgi:hypothetical protein
MAGTTGLEPAASAVTVKDSPAGNERNEAFTGAAVGNRWGYWAGLARFCSTICSMNVVWMHKSIRFIPTARKDHLADFSRLGARFSILTLIAVLK